MMKPLSFFALGTAVLGFVATASAATIVSTAVSGPGGTGTAGFSGTTVQPNIFFNTVDYLDVSLTVDSAGNYNFNQAPGIGGTVNFTGTAWIGFELTISSDNGATFTNSISPFFWQSYPDGTLAAFTPTKVTFSKPVAPASGFSFFGFINTTGPGTVTVRETPIAAPEPGSLGLLALSLTGLGFMRRRTT